ncbi:MAG: hypothetical protein ACAF41_03230 [Leptolyngbya sp. BL-A-14]
MTSSQKPSFFKNTKDFFNKNRHLISIKSLLALIAAPGILQIYQILEFAMNKQIREERAEKISQLSTYGTFGEIIKKYQGDIAHETTTVLKPKNQYKLVVKKSNFCDYLVGRYGRGIDIFYSESFKEYRSLHNFYEMLGLLIKEDVIDFDLVFSLFNFPGEFVDGIYPKDFRKNPLIAFDDCVAMNWFGKNHALIDHGDLVKQLGYNYNYKRLRLKLEQHEGNDIEVLKKQIKSLEDNQCLPFYPFDPPKSNKVYWNKLYVQRHGFFQDFQRVIDHMMRNC